MVRSTRIRFRATCPISQGFERKDIFTTSFLRAPNHPHWRAVVAHTRTTRDFRVACRHRVLVQRSCIAFLTSFSDESHRSCTQASGTTENISGMRGHIRSRSLHSSLFVSRSSVDDHANTRSGGRDVRHRVPGVSDVTFWLGRCRLMSPLFEFERLHRFTEKYVSLQRVISSSLLSSTYL